MKKALTLLASALFLLCAVPAVQAGVSISGMYGIMDTELLDEGEYYGGQLELGAGPISLIARGGYARDFDALNPDHWKFQNGDAVSSILDRFGVRTSDLNLDDFGIVPIEIGAIYRLNIVSGILNIYGGGGVGYYYIPAFDILGRNFSMETDAIEDLWGGWACLGVDAGVALLHVFAEAKYTWASSDVNVTVSRNLPSVNLDLDISGLSFIFGVRLGF